MIVKSGRGGGHTTQMFIEILASNKDILVWCRVPSVMVHRFCDLFDGFVKEKYISHVILIDGRKIEFARVDGNYSKIVGFRGEMKSDE